jgi:hypothetical protein
MKKLLLLVFLLFTSVSSFASTFGTGFYDALCVNCLNNPHISVYYLLNDPNFVLPTPLTIHAYLGIAIYLFAFIGFTWILNQNEKPTYNFKEVIWKKQNRQNTCLALLGMIIMFVILQISGIFASIQSQKEMAQFNQKQAVKINTFNHYAKKHIPNLNTSHTRLVLDNFIANDRIFILNENNYYEVLIHDLDKNGYVKIKKID